MAGMSGYAGLDTGLAREDSAGSPVPEKSWFWDFVSDQLTTYETAKLVRFKSPYLRVPELFFLVVICVYVVGYQLILQLQFMHTHNAKATVVSKLTGPQTDFWDCEETDKLCKYLYVSKEEERALEYCKNYDCKVFAGADISSSPGSHLGPGADLFIATHVRDEVLKECSEEDKSKCQNLWSPTTEATRSSFVSGIENYNVNIQLAYTSPAISRYFTAADTQGFLKFTHLEKPLPVPLHDLNASVVNAGYALGEPRGVGRPPCGDTIVESEFTCFSSVKGDVISLQQLLNASGVSLDDPIGDTNITRRQAGFILQLDIFVTNMDPWDFYFGFPGPKPKYIYEPHMLPLPAKHEPSWIGRRLASPVDESTRTQHVQWQHGVKVLVTVKGELGAASVSHALVVFAIAVTLVRVAKVVIDFVLVAIYKRFSSFEHIQMLHGFYRADEPPACHRLQGIKDTNGKIDQERFLRLHEEEMHLRTRRVVEKPAQ